MVSPRTQARRYAALALYQWRLTGEDPMAIKRHMLDDPTWLDAVSASLQGIEEDEALASAQRFRFNLELFEQLLAGVPERIEPIDAQLTRFLDRPIEQVDPVELAILRIGAFEILFSASIPDGVAINEAVELTKLLGAHEGHKYVNGVLDKIARHQAVARRAAERPGGEG
ncbi:transcription antitermination factor NusB [Marichromatium bheemlicum]|uniref:Transcription antitermination protein NusB n=1 Tax=Marichromatium bheemlicum TaxID=365339 RepID=A0ABX1IB50_9GAMM|nr:transcription antitermination factor NusB [Marichromatium bheemlicum]NKN33432.1 transcription antitermination factor NusB [Marichromatium bheemlicum]